MEIGEHRFYDDMDMKIPMGNLYINILYVRFVPADTKWVVGNHSHNSFELHFIPTGRGILRVNHHTYPIKPGTFYLTGPGIYHMQKTDEKDPMSEYCINFEFKRIKDGKASHNRIPQDEVDRIFDILSSTHYWFGEDEYNSMKLFGEIMGELEDHFLGYYIKIQNLLSQIIINAVRSYVQSKEVNYPLPKKIMDDRRGILIEEFFMGHYHQPVSPRDLAESLGIGQRQLNRILKKELQMNFKEKLISTRLDNAKEYLANTRHGIEEIGERVGFSSSSYFCKMFKKRTGMTPSDFRQQFSNNP